MTQVAQARTEGSVYSSFLRGRSCKEKPSSQNSLFHPFTYSYSYPHIILSQSACKNKSLISNLVDEHPHFRLRIWNADGVLHKPQGKTALLPFDNNHASNEQKHRHKKNQIVTELKLVFAVQIGLGKDERYINFTYSLPESVLTISICLTGRMVLRNNENVDSPKQVVIKRLTARTESILKATD